MQCEEASTKYAMQKNKAERSVLLSQIAVAIFAILAVVASVVLYTDYTRETEAAKEFQSLRSGVVSLPPAETVTPPQTPAELYAPLVEQNPDFAAWISIPGTTVDYPVMQTPQNPDYYLTHGFDKKYSPYGVPYASASSDLSPTGQNVVIYGHHTKNQGMFGALVAYMDPVYYQEHPQIQFHTLQEFGTYDIAAVFQTTADAANPDAFNYTNATSFADEAAFAAFWEDVTARMLYPTGQGVQYGDRLLLLSTCEYSQADGRLVVVAKRQTASPN